MDKDIKSDIKPIQVKIVKKLIFIIMYCAPLKMLPR